MNKQQNKLKHKENKQVTAGAWGELSEIVERDEEVQTTRYKRSKSQGCDIQHGEYCQLS